MDIFGKGHYSAYHNRRDLDTKVIYAFRHLLHVHCWVQFILFKAVEYMYSVHAFNACSMLSSIDVAELTHSFNTRVSVCQVLELDHVCPRSPSVGPRCLCHTGPESIRGYVLQLCLHLDRAFSRDDFIRESWVVSLLGLSTPTFWLYLLGTHQSKKKKKKRERMAWLFFGH